MTELDGVMIGERLDRLALDPDDKAYLQGLPGVISDLAGGGSLPSLMRRRAPAGHHYETAQDSWFSCGPRNGTVSLLQAVPADGGTR